MHELSDFYFLSSNFTTGPVFILNIYIILIFYEPC